MYVYASVRPPATAPGPGPCKDFVLACIYNLYICACVVTLARSHPIVCLTVPPELFFPKQSLPLGLWRRIFCIRHLMPTHLRALRTKILCADTVNGDGQVAPVQAEVVTLIAVAENKRMKAHIVSQLPLASCVPHVCFPGNLLDAHWACTAQDYMSSGPKRRQAFLFSRAICLLAGQEDVSSCPTRRLFLPFNQRASLLAEQGHMCSRHKKTRLRIKHLCMASCRTRGRVFLLNRKTCPLAQQGTPSS